MRKQSAVAIALGVLALGAVMALVQVRCVADATEAPSTPTASPRVRERSDAPAPTPPPTGPHSLRGRVVDARGQPVAGVQVSATRAMPGESLSELLCDGEDPDLRLPHPDCVGGPEEQVLQLIEQERGGLPVLAQVTTATDGTFRLDALPEGVVALWALGDVGATLEPEVATGREDVELVLADALWLSGHVLDESGAPLAGVRVTLFHQEHSRYFTTSTEADGRFAFGPLPDGAYGLVASSPGLLPAHLPDVAHEDLDTIVLHAPRRLIGQVLLADGTPAPGAEVRVQYTQHVIVTDRDGRFAFEALAPGDYMVLAERDGEHGFASVSLTEEEREAEATVRLGTLAYVEGVVRDEAGQPIAGASVTASFGESAPSFDDAATGADGRFRMGPLPLGSHTFGVDADGYLELEVEDVAVSISGPPLTFTLRRAFILAGLVTDTEGRPLPDVGLEAVRGKPSPRPASPIKASLANGHGVIDYDGHQATPGDDAYSAMSDEEGRFFLEVPEAGRYTLTASGGTFLTEQVQVDAPSQALQVVLRDGASLRGTVVDARDVPLEQVTVSVQVHSGEQLQGLGTMSDEQGLFTLGGLPPGTHTLKASVDLGGFLHQASRTVSVRGTETVDGSLRLDTGQSVSGVVVDGDGRPVPDAEVQGYSLREPSGDDQGFRPSTATTGPDGRFTVAHMPEGECALTASKEGHTFEEPAHARPTRWPGVIARSGARDVRLVLRYQGYVHGRVVDQDGTPIPRFSINNEGYRDPKGAFRISMEQAGTVRLRFEAPGLTLALREVEVPVGKDVDLGDVRLEPGRQLRGRVVDAETSQPVAQAEVRVNRVGEDPWMAQHSPLVMEHTRADGSFVLPLLERQPLDLEVKHGSFPAVRQRVGTGDEVLELRLHSGAKVKGTLRDREGRPVQAEVYLTPVDHGDTLRSVSAETLPGTFFAEGLAAGDYVVSALEGKRPDNSPVRFLGRRVSLPATGTVTLDLVEWVGDATLRLRVLLDTPERQSGLRAALVPGSVSSTATATELRSLVRLQGVPLAARNPDGTRLFEHVPAGHYTYLLLSEQTRGRPEVHREPLVVAEGESVVRDVAAVWQPVR